MIVTIEKSDKEAIQYACGLLDYKCSFYSNESKEGVMQAEITDTLGDEITRAMAWYICRQVEAKLASDLWSKK